MKQLQDAYIVSATRTPIGKSHRGFFRNYRPDDLLATTLRAALAQVPRLDPKAIEDIICGCAIPESQQGLNIARIGAVLAGLPNSIGGITVNRFCASGLSAVQMAADRIRVGEADVMIAAGVESMSMVPMMGNAPSLSPSIFEREGDVGIAERATAGEVVKYAGELVAEALEHALLRFHHLHAEEARDAPSRSMALIRAPKAEEPPGAQRAAGRWPLTPRASRRIGFWHSGESG